MKSRFIGLRTIKTVIAVIIGILVANHFELQSASIVATAVITSMATAIHESFRNSFFRLLSTFLGVVLAIFFQYIDFANAFSAGLGVMIIIVFCNLVKINRSIILGTLIFVSVLTYEFSTDQELISYGVNRLIDTAIGLFIGVSTNILLFKPKQELFLIDEYKKTLEVLEKSILGLLEGVTCDQDILVERLDKTSSSYLNLRNDVKIKMNNHVNIMDVQDINNKVILAVSLLIDINNMNQPLNLTIESREMINDYFHRKLMKDTKLKNQDLDSHKAISLNFEVRKLIRTMTEIDENIDKFEKVYCYSEE